MIKMNRIAGQAGAALFEGSAGEPGAVGLAAKPPRKYEMKDTLLAVGMLLIGFLFWNLNKFQSLGAGVTLFAAVLGIVSAIYLKLQGARLGGWRIIPLVIFGAAALLFVYTDQNLIKALNCWFIAGVYLFWIAQVAGQPVLAGYWPETLRNWLQVAATVPSRQFLHLPGSLKASWKNRTANRTLSSILGGGILMLPVLLIVTHLLTGTSVAFQSVIEQLGEFLTADWVIYLRQFLLGVPVACYLYGALYGNCYEARQTPEAAPQTIGKRPRPFLLPLTGAVGLSLLLGLYAFYFVIQSAYLFGAFRSLVPDSLTYAEYARQGFFELCAVALVNLCVIIAIHLLTAANEAGALPRWLRAELVALDLGTIVLIGVAFRKMQLYISAYGLTPLRVYTSWFMVLLLFVFGVLIVRQCLSFHSVRWIVVGAAIWFLILGYGNPDGLIARYNVDRALNGSLQTLRMENMSELSAAAVPALIDLYQKTDRQELKTEIRAALRNPDYYTRKVELKDFRNYNQQAARAIKEITASMP